MCSGIECHTIINSSRSHYLNYTANESRSATSGTSVFTNLLNVPVLCEARARRPLEIEILQGEGALSQRRA